MVAVSQAPSPESSPDSPLPVITMAGHDPAITVDRSEIRMARRRLSPCDPLRIVFFHPVVSVVSEGLAWNGVVDRVKRFAVAACGMVY